MAAIVAANIFAWVFVRAEQTVYFWDYAIYWMKFETVARGLHEYPLQEWLRLDSSIRHQEYNNVALWPLSPFAWFGGTSRLIYILSVVNVWMIPAALTFLGSRRDRPLDLFIIFTCPILWVAVLRGWFDVGGLIFANLVLAMAYQRRSSTPIPPKALLVMAVGLAMLPLFRRWYSFWGLSFWVVFVVDGLCDSAVSRDRKKALFSIRQGLALGAFTAILITAFSWPMPLTVLKTDYRELLSSYRFNTSALGSLRQVLGYLGGCYSLMALGGFVGAVFDRSLRRFALFLVAQTALILWLFFHVQDLGTQHYLLLLPPLIFFLIYWIRLVRHPVWTGAHLFLIIASFAWVFIPGAEKNLAFARPLLPGVKCHPFYRDDIAEIRRLRDTLSRLNPHGQDRVYVLSSSPTLNSHTLNLSERSLGWPKQIEGTILWTRSVDKSEGFPADFFTARYVVVAQPVQYHMAPKKQEVVGYLAEHLLKGDGPGLFYKRLPQEFRLERGVRVFLFERTGKIGEQEISEIRAYFLSRYPEWGAFPINGV